MNALVPITPDTQALALPRMDTYDARDLVRDGVSAQIVLDDKTYVLRITKAGKLILTK